MMEKEREWQVELINEDTGQVTMGVYDGEKSAESAANKFNGFMGYTATIIPPGTAEAPSEKVTAHMDALNRDKVREGDGFFYARELKSNECACGEEKGKNKSFCFSCFKKLPDGIAQDLYLKIGEGYEQAYDAALQHLSEAS